MFIEFSIIWQYLVCTGVMEVEEGKKRSYVWFREESITKKIFIGFEALTFVYYRLAIYNQEYHSNMHRCAYIILNNEILLQMYNNGHLNYKYFHVFTLEKEDNEQPNYSL